MKLSNIIALLSLSVLVKGLVWTAALAQPLVLGLGALLGAIDLDVLDIHHIEFKSFLHFAKKSETI